MRSSKSSVLTVALASLSVLFLGCFDIVGPDLASRGPVIVAAVTVQPARARLNVGASIPVTAVAQDSTGTPLPDQPVVWSSSDSAIATVSPSGEVHALSPGNAIILATSDTSSGAVNVTVTPVPVAAVSITPSSLTIVVGGSGQLSATPEDSAGDALAGRVVTWTSSNTSVARVDGNGRVTGFSHGSVAVRAESEGQASSVTVNVNTPPPMAVATVTVTPASASMTVGGAQQLTAVERDVNNNTLSGRTVSWSSSNSSVATVSAGGLVTAKSGGTATITATSEGQSDNAAITVTAAPVAVAGVRLSPSPLSLQIGDTQQENAQPVDAGGNALSGRAVSWATSNNGAASVSSNGLITAKAAGTATITATSEGKSGTVGVTVSAPPPPPPVPVAVVSVMPGSANLNVGQTAQFSSTERDANGATLTGRVVTWSSSSTAIATVSGSGLVTATGGGSATITATSEGKSGTAVVIVSVPPPPPAPVAEVDVAPGSASLNVGQTVQLASTEKDAGGTVLSGRAVTWKSSNGGVATVSGSGLVTAKGAGTATITATSEGISGTAAMTVSAPPPPPPAPVAEVDVVPSSASVTVSQTKQLSATEKDGSGNVLSGRTVGWSSSNSGVASVSSNGLVTANANGSATITATSEGVNGTSSITVTTQTTGGGGEPTPSGAIVFDTRTSLSTLNSVADVKNYFDNNELEYLGTIGFTTNMDGNGRHAIRMDWPARSYSQGEEQVTLQKTMSVSGKFCTAWKVHFGRTATGGGVGAVDQWGLSQGTNAHIKHVLFVRENDDRIYFAMRHGYYVLSIDGRNWDSTPMDFSQTGEPLNMAGVDQRWTACITPGNPGAVQVWFQGHKVLDQANANIGSSSLTSLQFPATFLTPLYTQSDYWWDVVLWKP